MHNATYGTLQAWWLASVATARCIRIVCSQYRPDGCVYAWTRLQICAGTGRFYISACTRTSLGCDGRVGSLAEMAQWSPLPTGFRMAIHSSRRQLAPFLERISPHWETFTQNFNLNEWLTLNLTVLANCLQGASLRRGSIQ